jgi:hypothetical protein
VLRTMRKSSWGKTIPVYVISNLSEDQVPGIRDLGIAGYTVKANMEYGRVDEIVNQVLHPEAPQQPTEEPKAS